MKRGKLTILIGATCFASGAFITKIADDKVTVPVLQQAQKLIRLNFTAAQLDSATEDVQGFKESYESIRKVPLPNNVALVFNPIPVGYQFETKKDKFEIELPKKVKLPANRDDLAFYNVRQLTSLIRLKQISSGEFTKVLPGVLKEVW